MRFKLKVSMLIAVVLGASFPGHASAQAPGTKVPVPHNQVLSANPILLLFEWANVEYERKISPTGTVGVAGSWVSFDDGNEEYRGLSAFYRYYPQGAALTGFYFGGKFGYHWVSDYGDTGSAFGLGIDIGYSWLLGESRSFYVGLGVGASRLFGNDLEDDSVTIPTIRLVNIGFAF